MSQTVLMIDDSIPLHKLVKAHLESNHLTVHSAYDGDSGLALVLSLRPSLILLDVDMPEMDGFEVCRRIKANPATSDIPLMFLTANAMVADKVRGLSLGALDYVTKPFKPRELLARVRAALRVKTQADATTMVDGLTGLWNRAYLNLHLNSQIARAKHLDVPLACIVAEMDRPQGLSVKHGAAAANQALRAIGRILLSQCRAEDLVCRLDEWKFVLLATGANRAAAALMAERIRAEIQRQLQNQNGIETRITCSLGVSDTLIADEATLIDRAEASAGRAREDGCNRVFIAGEDGDELHVAA